MAARKLTPKQDRFALRYHELGDASKAYREAYQPKATAKPNTIHRRAHELLNHPRVLARIRELEERQIARHDTTVDSLVAELDEAKALAWRLEQPAAMVAAILGKARVTGHLKPRGPSFKPKIYIGYRVPEGAQEGAIEGEFQEIESDEAKA